MKFVDELEFEENIITYITIMLMVNREKDECIIYLKSAIKIAEEHQMIRAITKIKIMN